MCDDLSPTGIERDACCAPPNTSPARSRAPVLTSVEPRSGDAAPMLSLPGGAFLMGTDEHIGYLADGEGPAREVRLEAFDVDPVAVSNRRFSAFVEATGYVTDAERCGWSFVFAGLLPDDFEETSAVAAAPWWRQVWGASFRHPEGPQSDLSERLEHPVVHVSHDDALAFCAWAGARLPTEAEWEYAARGGLEQRRYPWGDELTPGGEQRCNIWQGEFPVHNSLDDGYYGTAPVDAYAPNGFGLYNVSGNVWEWCDDWFSPRPDMVATTNPQGPLWGEYRVMRGGSYLCHESYCFRYRVAARSANTPNSSTGNLGFRCAANAARG